MSDMLREHTTCSHRILASMSKTELDLMSPLRKVVVTCKIKHLQKCFAAVDFRRLCGGRKNVVRCFI